MEGRNLHRWLIPLVSTAILLAALLFYFPFNSSDSLVKNPLGWALWTLWTRTDIKTLDYSYCPLVPLVVAYLVFERRSRIAATPVGGTNAAIGAILVGLLLFWIGSRAGKPYLGGAGIQIFLLGVVFWFWGRSVFRLLVFAWAMITFAWPFPGMDTAVAFPLRMIVSHLASATLNLIGVGCIRNGTALLSAPDPTSSLPLGARFQIDIADPCSGLHSIPAMLIFSALYAYFFLPRRWQQWTVFLSAIPFAVVGNVFRILMLVMGCIAWGPPFAIGTNDHPSWFHEACGFAVFAVVLGLQCLLGFLLVHAKGSWSTPAKTTAPENSELAKAPSPSQPQPGEVPAWRSGIVLGLTVLMALVYWMSPSVNVRPEPGVVMSLPDEVAVPNLTGGHFSGVDAPVSEPEHLLLPKDTEFTRKNYDDFHGHEVFFSIVLSGTDYFVYSLHPPEVCLVAQGWSIVKTEDIPVELSSGHKLVARNLTIQRDVTDVNNEHRLLSAYYMYWYVADGATTPSHAIRDWVNGWGRVIHNRDHRWAYVIAKADITQSIRPDGLDAEQTLQMLKSFIRQIVPAFQISELPGRDGRP